MNKCVICKKRDARLGKDTCDRDNCIKEYIRQRVKPDLSEEITRN